jgi:hypothetical protein
VVKNLAATAGKFGTSKKNERLRRYIRKSLEEENISVDDYRMYTSNYKISIKVILIYSKRSVDVYRMYERSYKISIQVRGIYSIRSLKKYKKEKRIIRNDKKKKYIRYYIRIKMSAKYGIVNSLVCVEPVQKAGKVRVHEWYGVCTVSIRKQLATGKSCAKSVCTRRSTSKINARVTDHLSRKICMVALNEKEGEIEKRSANKNNTCLGRMYIVIGGGGAGCEYTRGQEKQREDDRCV